MESESGKFACAHQARWVSEVQPFFVPLTLRCGLDSLEYTAAKKVAPRQRVSWRNGSTVTWLANRRRDIFCTRIAQNHSSESNFAGRLFLSRSGCGIRAAGELMTLIADLLH